MSTYQIMNRDASIGTLETAADGLYTVFTARCEPVSTRLRLAVYGRDRCAYLGLMLPGERGALCLKKRLTRLEVSRLPDPILFAAEEGREPPAFASEAAEAEWKRASDGTLRRRADGTEYVAVPAERVRAPVLPRQLLCRIRGRDYLVFPL